MAIQVNTRQSHKHVQKLIEQRLKELGDELGVRFECYGGQYGDTPHIKIRIHTEGNSGEIESPEVKNFKRDSWIYHISPDALNEEVMLQGDYYQIVGLKPTSRKRPIVTMRLDDNSIWNWSGDAVIGALEQKKRVREAMKDVTPVALKIEGIKL